MTITAFAAAKGGQGCSTVAALYATAMSTHTPTVLVDMSPQRDIDAMFGPPYDEPAQLGRNLTLADNLRGYQHDVCYVIDYGTNTPEHPYILVTQPCYLAMRAAVRLPQPPSGIVLTFPEDRTLTAKDVEAIVGAPVIHTMHRNPIIARYIDAGIVHHLPDHTTLLAHHIERTNTHK
jgi:hypothetical protein